MLSKKSVSSGESVQLNAEVRRHRRNNVLCLLLRHGEDGALNNQVIVLMWES